MSDLGSFLYLTSADIKALELTPVNMESAVEAAFKAISRGGARTVPKDGFDVTASTFFHSMPAEYGAGKVVGIKWIGVALNEHLNLPHTSALIVLNDIETAMITAVMDGTLITAMRPATISLIAARRLAKADSRRLGLIACGTQAMAHIDAFSGAFPLKEITCHSRRRETAEAFAREVEKRGFSATVAATAREAVEGQDIVVSTVPRVPGLKPFLDPAWLSPGSFATGVDLARSWICDDLRQIDILATDDHAQSKEAGEAGILPWRGGYDAELQQLLSGAHPGRRNDKERAFFIHPGQGLGDIAIALAACDRAKAAGLGVMLVR
ncbi:MAG: ornithine cyclodeaminase family protein [Bradyrhizobium sp.]|uniref:ornithine cyclodeaminase family protein n=1 Tax=Bradyrhizobium sp. TaxID=376 RepID=UPI003D0CFB75